MELSEIDVTSYKEKNPESTEEPKVGQDLGELLYFDDVLFTAEPDSPAVDRYLAQNPSEECVVFIDVNEYAIQLLRCETREFFLFPIP